MFRLNPQTVRKLSRFKHIRRGYYSFIALTVLFALTLAGELLVNSRALVVSFDGQMYFPTYTRFHPGTTFGLDYEYETNYRDLKALWREEGSENWLLMPIVPYNPYENDASTDVFTPTPPSLATRHFLGTDTTNRDILARLFYGIRIALIFSLAFMVAVYCVGISVGCSMGFFGGVFDLIFQRLIEVWSNIPFLYMVIIIFSVVPDTVTIASRVTILLLVMVLFSWTSMTYYMRTETYKEKARDYVASARVIGASNFRIIFRHVLPNVLSTLVTFMPFTVIGAISAITALDFLGFGLPPPTPSVGELLKQGTANLRTAPWIVSASFGALVVLLTLVTFVGEAIRESFDPRRFAYYK